MDLPNFLIFTSFLATKITFNKILFMSDLHTQLDKAMDEIKEEMIKDIIDAAAHLNNQERKSSPMEIIELTK